MRTFRRVLRKWKADESGAAAMMVALMLPVLAGVAALSVDVLFAYNQQEQLRTAAEAAATAAVTALPDRAGARSAALSYAVRNVRGDGSEQVVGDDDVQIGRWDLKQKTFTPVGEAERANAVRITASRTAAKGNAVPTFFGQVLGVSAFNAVSASAVAMQPSSYPCINVLAPDATGLKLNSNGKIDLNHCGIHVHSSNGSAMMVESNARVNVADAEICVKGGVQTRSNSTVSPTPDTGCSPLKDQFADVPLLSLSSYQTRSASQKTINGTEKDLLPGIYVGGVTINSNGAWYLKSGEYIIKDGPLIINSNAAISGTDAVIYLTGANAQVIFNSNAKVNLTAPSTGPMAGFVLYQDRNYGGDHTFNSNASTVLSGAIYLPKGTIKMNSNTQIGSTSMCMMIVAYRIEINSNSGVNITPDYAQCPLPVKARTSRLVQ